MVHIWTKILFFTSKISWKIFYKKKVYNLSQILYTIH